TVNHFQCYGVDHIASTPAIDGVSLNDHYGNSTVTVSRITKFCAPADNGSDPTAPSDVDHLVGYRIRQTSPDTDRKIDQILVDEFGTLEVDLARPELLLVPAAKSLTEPAPPVPSNPAVDHF